MTHLRCYSCGHVTHPVLSQKAPLSPTPQAVLHAESVQSSRLKLWMCVCLKVKQPKLAPARRRPAEGAATLCRFLTCSLITALQCI